MFCRLHMIGLGRGTWFQKSTFCRARNWPEVLFSTWLKPFPWLRLARRWEFVTWICVWWTQLCRQQMWRHRCLVVVNVGEVGSGRVWLWASSLRLGILSPPRIPHEFFIKAIRNEWLWTPSLRPWIPCYFFNRTLGNRCVCVCPSLPLD